jgi:WD40 repeat protein
MENLEKLKNHLTYLNTECSPSHLFNNLQINDKHILFIHNSEAQPRIITVDKKLLTESQTNDKLKQHINKLNNNETSDMILFKSVQLLDTYYIAVGLYGGFKLWSSDGSRLLFNIPCKIKKNDKPYAFTAITEFKSNHKNKHYDSLIVADNYGQIFLVTGSGSNWKGKIIYANEISSNILTPTAISAGLNLNTNYICIGYETGDVLILKLKNDNSKAELIQTIPCLNNLPCLSMGVIETSDNNFYLLNAYLNGEIRIYKTNMSSSPDKFFLISILGAHIRMITALTIYKNYFITAGDDCYVNIWKLDKNENVTLESSHELPDRMPIGVQINHKSESFDLLVGCYDNTELIIIHNPLSLN